MKESATYQAILEEGRTEGRNEGAIVEVRKVLRRLGDKAFGPPDAHTAADLDAIEDLERLEGLCERVSSSTNWQELLGRTPVGRRSGRRGRRRPPRAEPS